MIFFSEEIRKMRHFCEVKCECAPRWDRLYFHLLIKISDEMNPVFIVLKKTDPLKIFTSLRYSALPWNPILDPALFTIATILNHHSPSAVDGERIYEFSGSENLEKTTWHFVRWTIVIFWGSIRSKFAFVCCDKYQEH